MTRNRFDLDHERLATTDESGQRVYLYPEDVKGPWKNRRDVVYWVLILIYMVLPWIYINGKPALMINIFTREFTFFGSSFIGIEPILLFLLVSAALFLIAWMTSLYGRVWCGWACPQTVYIQTLFMKIEAMIEGSARTRKALESAPWTFEKIMKRTFKWLIFTVISAHIAHTFIGYLIGPRELLAITLRSPFENFGLFLTAWLSTLIVLIDFGWFREQFCIIACPYGRMQSVIMDDNSLVIAYDQKRGEPRRGSNHRNENEGDCINCYHCVKVCPTGIDIRRGTQLECIACTQCIDACDEIMIKIKKPTGLIAYSSQNKMDGIKKNGALVRPLIYFMTALGLIVAFIYFLSASAQLEAVFIRGKNEPFTLSTTDHGMHQVTNHFTLKIVHQGGQDYAVDFHVDDQRLADKVAIITPVSPVQIDGPEKKIIIFFNFAPDILENGSRKLKINIYDHLTKATVATKEVVLVGPSNK